MNFAALSPARQRLVIAMIASLAIHALLMWLPPIQLPEAEPDLPPLAARLIALPQATHQEQRPAVPPAQNPYAEAIPRLSSDPDATDVAASSVATAPTEIAATSATSAPAAASAVAAAPSPAATQTMPPAASAVAAHESDSPASQVAAASSVVAASSIVAASSVTASSAVSPVLAEVAPPRPTLPKHAFLKFQVRLGKDGMAVGEARHELEIDNGRYELTATTRTIGLARLVKSYKLVQTSNGTTDGVALYPEQYSEDKQNDGEQRKDSVKLDYSRQQLLFASGRKLPLKEPTQDILSILYQFPPLPELGDVLPIAITNGRDWEQYKFEIATNEELITPLGKLHTVHFRKLHPPGKEGLEIWFAQEYRLLPVKLRHIERDGSIAGEAIITDIRIAEN